MKPKLICLIIILIGSCLAASPKNYCGGVRCPVKPEKQGTTTSPVKKVVLMIDDLELLPSHHFLNIF
ncbi:hypothetical protein Niako_1206 [Niastella koreensis GR20-10]|uniref:Uncharacterized protein n=2 Tax=Niastella koreensis TaxID=354356 RepID=G8TKC5_NIAKG|nr:hypothetical protein [Niastella koreensis]AEV97581.1 hypothetical protein Niako_1206 [Niastella koreensis GR20-10]